MAQRYVLLSRCLDAFEFKLWCCVQGHSELLFVCLSPEHYANISLELADQGDETDLRMECRGVPVGEEESTREGWTRFYFQAIKQTFGY